ncbi:hypothetical protein QFC24_006805 [Naganishia onofrii]|uniref:Uncharacterized protein n=1 Tax=Naganishia onofrii TaxID=1851511 RepID=A0ACC2WWS2_9TREE|nr:hypothetical protein QFC24_006805 [Naganishia onofrii]
MASETAKDRLTAPKVRVNQEKTKISIMMNLFPLDPARKFELPVTFAMPSGEEKYVAWLAAITEAFHSPEVQAKLVKYPFASDPAPYQPEFKMNKTRDVLEMLIGLPIEYLTKYTAETDGAHCLPNNVETWFTTSVYQTSGQATCSGIITNRKPKLEDMLPWFQSSNGIPMVTYQPDTGIRPILYNAADQRYR